MANVMASPTFFPRRINLYVPAMQYADAVNEKSATRIPLGAPPVAVGNNILNALALTANANTNAVLTNNANAQDIPDPWGRCIQLVASVANTGVCILRGADYLGQPMREDIALAGATIVQTRKCFKYLDSIFFSSNGATPGTVSAGWGTGLGLPYKTLRVTAEIVDGLAVSTAPVHGTNFIPPVLTNQTATTVDPRGKYVPLTALNGARTISIVADCVNDLNSSEDGGLHGIKHFFA
jgi:hypothetical protein